MAGSEHLSRALHGFTGRSVRFVHGRQGQARVDEAITYTAITPGPRGYAGRSRGFFDLLSAPDSRLANAADADHRPQPQGLASATSYPERSQLACDRHAGHGGS